MSWIYPTWLKQAITEADNMTVDAKRLIGFWFAGQFSFQNGWAVIINHQPFDPPSFATGAAALLAGLGAAIMLGKSGETPHA